MGTAQWTFVPVLDAGLLKTVGAEGVATAEGGRPVEHLQADRTLELLAESRAGLLGRFA